MMESENSSSSVSSLCQLRQNVRSDHALGLLESLQSLRDDKTTCDFVVKVENENFPVHRSILAACSEYFRAMFEHDMRESTEGVVDMKEVQRDAVEKCISFMYTGLIDVDFTNVQEILHVASLMQLENLMQYCFGYMQLHITAENCLFVQKLARLFCKEEEQYKAEEYAKNHLHTIILSPDFLDLSFVELIRFIKCSTQTHHVIWQAVVTWMKADTRTRPSCINELLQCIGLSKFPVEYLLSTVLKEDLVINCKICRDLLISVIYEKVGEAEASINAHNCYDWRNFTKLYLDHDNAEVLSQIVRKYMIRNFEKIASDAKFLDLSADDVFQFLHSEASTIFLWKSMLRWVKHADDRHHHLHKMLNSLNFENISVDCIQEIFMSETLVKQSHECKDILFDIICSKAKVSDAQQSSTEKMPNPKPRPMSVPIRVKLRHNVSSIKKESIGNDCFSQCKNNVIALLDTDKNNICYLDSGNNRTQYSLPMKTKLMRVVSLDNSFYLLCDDQLFLFDGNDTWKELKSHPILPDKRTNIVTFQNRIYTLDFEEMYYYYPVTDKWSQKLPVSDVEVEFCVASSKEYIYVMGGHSLQDRCLRYTPRGKHSKRWSEIAAMCEKRNNAAAACLDGVIYVLGGLVGDRAVKSVECYDPDVGSWCYISSMNFCHRRFSACVADGKLYAVGGAFKENGKDREHRDVIEIYVPEKSQWSICRHLDAITLPISACSFTSS